MSRSLTFLFALILCTCCKCDENKSLEKWLSDSDLYEINVAGILKQNGIINMTQLQSINKIKLHKIWQTATDSVYQRLLKQLHNKSQVDVASHHEKHDDIPMCAENNAILQKWKQEAAEKKEKLNTFLKHSQLTIFQNVFQNNNVSLDELKMFDIDKIINISYNETTASKFDHLRLRVYVTKLQNDVNIDESDIKHLRITKQKHIDKDENNMIQNWRDKQLNTNRFITMIANMSRNIEYQFTNKIADIDVFISNLSIESKRKNLINDLTKWTDEKITQLHMLTQNIESYSNNLQKILNKYYKNIGNDNLNDRERREILISDSRKLNNNYSLFQNSSLFAPYINDMSSSIKLRFQNVSKNTNDFAVIEKKSIYSIPIVTIVAIYQSLFERKTKQINATVLWKYVYTINNNITNYYTKDVCNQVKIFVDNNKHKAESEMISQNDTIVLCESDVIIKDSQADGFGQHEFRIEYELRMRNKMILKDTMNNDKYLLLKLLNEYDLNDLNVAHMFVDRELYLNDVLYSDKNTTDLIVQNKIKINNYKDENHICALDENSKNIFVQVNSCAAKTNQTTDIYSNFDDLFEQLKLAAAFAKWKNEQNIKLNYKQVYEISQLVVLNENNKRLLNLVPTELSRTNDLFSDIFDEIKQFEAEYYANTRNISAAFDELNTRKHILQKTLNEWKINKFSQIINSLNHIELRNRFMQKQQNKAYTYITDYGKLDATTYDTISNSIYQYEIVALFKNALNVGIGSFADFYTQKYDSWMQNYGKIERKQKRIIPDIKLTNISHSINENKEDQIVLNWYYVGEHEGNICDSILIYQNNTKILNDITNTVVEIKDGRNKFDSLVKCQSVVKPFSIKKAETYRFTIKHKIKIPLKGILSDVKEWNYIGSESQSMWFTLTDMVSVVMDFIERLFRFLITIGVLILLCACVGNFNTEKEIKDRTIKKT